MFMYYLKIKDKMMRVGGKFISKFQFLSYLKNIMQIYEWLIAFIHYSIIHPPDPPLIY